MNVFQWDSLLQCSMCIFALPKPAAAAAVYHKRIADGARAVHLVYSFGFFVYTILVMLHDGVHQKPGKLIAGTTLFFFICVTYHIYININTRISRIYLFLRSGYKFNDGNRDLTWNCAMQFKVSALDAVMQQSLRSISEKKKKKSLCLLDEIWYQRGYRTRTVIKKR